MALGRGAGSMGGGSTQEPAHRELSGAWIWAAVAGTPRALGLTFQRSALFIRRV
jgi:hypothetical protein